MPKGKNRKKKKAAAKVAAAKPAPKPQPKKKKGVASMMARGALSAAAGVANGVFPGSGLLINHLGKAALNALGLSEKTVLPKEYGGGSTGLTEGGAIVSSADAPVAFGRSGGTTAFSKVLHRAGNGDVIVHIREALRDIITNAVVNTKTTTIDGLYPTSASMALSRNLGVNFQLYRILAAKVHYTHWSPTSTKARVSLASANDYQMNNTAVPGSFVEFSQLEDFACGSCYEDFALEWDPEPIQNWYYNFPTPSEDDRANVQSVLYTQTDLNSTTTDTIGTIFLEWVIAFHGTRAITPTVGIAQTLFDPPTKVAIPLTPDELGTAMKMLALLKASSASGDSQSRDLLSRLNRMQPEALVLALRQLIRMPPPVGATQLPQFGKQE